MDDDKQQTNRKRIFINNIDRYSSKHVAKFLSTCVAGESFEEEEGGEEQACSGGEPSFDIVGTLSAPTSDGKDSFLLEQYVSPTREELLQHLLECDVVVYNISESVTQQDLEEATWAITALHEKKKTFKSRKEFILVSTVMTWARTKPQNSDETQAVFSEEEFKRRKPHPSFRNHNELEKLVLKLGAGKKSKLGGYVVACGLLYGKGENLFHYFFKVSWLMQFPQVPLFGEGANYIPMIHVYDLGRVLQNIIELRPTSKYILAVDDSKNTLEDIVQMISTTLGPGKINRMPEYEAIATNAFKSEELEYLSINLQLDAVIIKENFHLQWTSEAGMLQNMESIVEEYKETRQLLPIRICVVGPPAVGKTTVAEKLCSHYKIHHIKMQDVTEGKIRQLTETVAGAESGDISEEEAAAARNQLDNLNKSLTNSDGRLTDQLVDILQQKLNSKPCRNQGFVLDGFPETYEQAKQIFSEVDEENQDSKSKRPKCNKQITPEHIFTLNATDEFLTERVQGLPQAEAENMSYTQEEFVSRLMKYRQLNSAKETLLHYFDELELIPEEIEVTTGDSEYTEVMKKITKVVGLPKNFGLSPEEQEELDRKNEEEWKKRVAAEAGKRKDMKEAALAEMAAEYEQWQKHLSELKRQESELQEARSLPLRNYLMKYVMPSLSEAMVDCCKITPEDPVDFLAEYLMRSNQQEQ
ncbi:uncharacterized protein V6R79_017437 [Siganus canaliculatus]